MSDNYRKQLEGLLQQQYDLRYEYEQRISLTTDPIQRDRDKLSLDGVKKRIKELKEELGITPQHVTPPSSVTTPAGSINTNTPGAGRSRLLQILDQRFSLNDLKSLCFNLDGVDYDSLEGDGKSGKARELILYMERRNRLIELENKIKEIRPDI